MALVSMEQRTLVMEYETARGPAVSEIPSVLSARSAEGLGEMSWGY